MSEKRESFVFYRSFADSIRLAPSQEQNTILRYLVDCALGDMTLNDVPYPYDMALNQMLANVDAAQKHYAASIENGKKGGRPPKWVDRTEAEMLHEELGTWEKVADELNVSKETLRKARTAWKKQDAQKPKNPNVNLNVNGNFNENENYQLTNKYNAPSPGVVATATPGDSEKNNEPGVPPWEAPG